MSSSLKLLKLTSLLWWTWNYELNKLFSQVVSVRGFHHSNRKCNYDTWQVRNAGGEYRLPTNWIWFFPKHTTFSSLTKPWTFFLLPTFSPFQISYSERVYQIIDKYVFSLEWYHKPVNSAPRRLRQKIMNSSVYSPTPIHIHRSIKQTSILGREQLCISKVLNILITYFTLFWISLNFL